MACSLAGTTRFGSFGSMTTHNRVPASIVCPGAMRVRSFTSRAALSGYWIHIVIFTISEILPNTFTGSIAITVA